MHFHSEFYDEPSFAEKKPLLKYKTQIVKTVLYVDRGRLN